MQQNKEGVKFEQVWKSTTKKSELLFWIYFIMAEKRLAWVTLKQEAKDALAAARAGGLFGGTPDEAPYGWVQEYGNLNAAVKAKPVIGPTAKEFDDEIDGILADVLTGLQL